MNPKNLYLIKETHGKISRFEDLSYLRIDCNFNHFIISLVLATVPYGKAKEIEMIEDLARVTPGNVRCFYNFNISLIKSLYNNIWECLKYLTVFRLSHLA